MEVSVAVKEVLLGSTLAQAVSSANFRAETKRITLDAAASEAQNECQTFLVEKGLQMHQPFPKDPIGPIAFPDDFRVLDAIQKAEALQKIGVFHATNAKKLQCKRQLWLSN